MSVTPLFLFAAIAIQSPADSLRILALRLPPSSLAGETRARPLLVREAINDALMQSVRGPPAARPQAMEEARRLAAGYALAWADSFLMREVARFGGWSADRRAGKLWADSVRRAGTAAYGRDGPKAAILIWRRALARARSLPDTAGMTAVLSNIGSALLSQGRLDSAEATLERARGLARAIGDLRAEATVIGTLAGLSEERGDLAAARRRYGESLPLRERAGDTRGIAADHNNLGLLAQSAGDLDEAKRQFDAALALNRREGRADVAATNLVNLAGLASLMGDFARSEALYHDALATWRKLEQWVDAADALHGLGQLELRRGDYPAARGALAEALAIYERAEAIPAALAVRRALAGAQAAAGDLQGALDQLRQAQALADSADVEPDARAGVALARADLAAALNAHAEAERLYGRAEALYRRANDGVGAAEARQGLATLLLSRGDHARTLGLLQAALTAQQTAGDHRSAGLTRVALGRLAAARGDTIVARRQLARAAAELGRSGDPVATAEALGERAAVEAAAGLPVEAARWYQQALERLGSRVAPDVAWRLHAGLGLALQARGSTETAVRELRAAIAEVERSGRSLALPERRSGFLADKWAVYGHLAQLEQRRQRAGAAFELSERLRAREMLDLLGRGRIAAQPQVPAELVVREQDLRRRIAELTRGLGAAVGAAERGSESVRGPDLPDAGSAGHEALLRAQEDYAELLRDLRERAPRHAALLPREPAAWREVARRLGTDQAFIEYLLSDSASLAFVLTADTLAAVELGVTRRELARLVEFARGTLEPSAARRPDSLWRAPLRQLHRHLVQPIEATGLLDRKRRLVLVPHGELHYLPFAALIGDQGGAAFLIERFELLVTPSASVWLALGDRTARRAAHGLLAFAPRGDALPATRREVDAIAELLGGAGKAVSGRAATEELFRREAPGRRVVHLATYGVLNKHNPLFSFMELAPGGIHDGRLEVHEVFGLDLAADLVVLSACQTGLGSGALADVPAGDDWIGLTRAFLHAGAATVVATLWPVDDWATAGVMERFYQDYVGGGDPVRALAAAQRAALAAPSPSHPFAWAGLVVVGGDHGN